MSDAQLGSHQLLFLQEPPLVYILTFASHLSSVQTLCWLMISYWDDTTLHLSVPEMAIVLMI